MVFKSSLIWAMSSDALIEHLSSLETPDQIYWDSQSMKNDGRKFQSPDRSDWLKPAKIDGERKFAESEPPPVKAAPAKVIAVPPRPVAPPSANKIAPDKDVIAALETMSSEALDRWVYDDCPNPAPEAILLAKQQSGAGWTAVMRAARTMVGGTENLPASTVSVADRIEREPACDIINLTESEKDIYSGAGWKLARFEDGRLVEFFDPMNLPYNSDTQRAADAMADATSAWIDTAAGEIWLVMCSCYQLCEPRRVTFDAMAHVLRVFADQLRDF